MMPAPQLGAGVCEIGQGLAIGCGMRISTRRHLPVGIAAAIFVVALAIFTSIYVPAADGVTRSLRFSGKAIALTFDDGPDPTYTPAVLDILRDHEARATFFVLGDAAARHPELIARMIDEGHEVAFHSHTHPHVDLLSDHELRGEMHVGLSVLRERGVDPIWYRPPRGRLTDTQTLFASEHGMRVALWTRCMERARFRSAQEMAATLASETRRGDIVLAHDGLGNRSMTVEALPCYLDALRQDEIHVVTLSELAERAPMRWSDARIIRSLSPSQ